MLENSMDSALLDVNCDTDCNEVKEQIFDIIRNIQDPEKVETLEELKVVYEDGVVVKSTCDDYFDVSIEFKPTVPHCSLATLIGLSIRVKLLKMLPHPHKLNIVIQKGTHDSDENISKQINDKERVYAAMENPDLLRLVEKCIAEEY